ncbi:MAG: PPC domain-containing protein, partial [Deltaproteobacteria bacterium]|nr:PPC domain-containing protein [Deltaproteobacteria bacterium]
CNSNGSCADDTGVAVCTCDTGYTGAACDSCDTGFHLDSGSCVADDPTCAVNDPCVNGTCQYNNGVQSCLCDAHWTGDTCDACAAGYQDVNNDGTCSPDCTTAALSCLNGGSCVESVTSGYAECDCIAPWTGASCDSCDTGFHLDSGSCVADDPTCAENDLCVNGTCQYSNGVQSCSCDLLWTGDTCDACAAGYQDANNDGTCNPDCATAALSCLNGGSCVESVTSGYAECNCIAPWTGAVCDSCDTGFHLDSGSCVVDDPTCAESDPCVYGTCEYSNGVQSCSCDYLWTGDNCDACSSGYQDENNDGTCYPDCSTATINCLNGGSCYVDGTSGVATCDCTAAAPWTGAECDSCPNSLCDGVCCASGDSCHLDTGTCCNVTGTITCDTISGAPECGLSSSKDECGNVIDCGDCGANGTCSGNTCTCDREYTVPTDKHECIHACDAANGGYLTTNSGGCCDSEITYFCSSSKIKYYDCFEQYYATPSLSVCGYYGGSNDFFNCGGTDTPTTSIEQCPANILALCVDDNNEPSDTLAKAKALSFGTTQLYLQICPGNTDWFKLTTVGVGDVITVTLTFTNADGNLDMDLVNSSGVVVDSATTTDDNEVISFKTTIAGIYYVNVKGATASDENEYSILAENLAACVADANEVNNDYASATDVTTATLSGLTICEGDTSGDEDWFMIDGVAEGDNVAASITFTHSTGDLNLYLYNDPSAAPVALSESVTNGESVNYKADASHTGTFYVKVTGLDRTVRNNYSMTASAGQCDAYELNDTIATAASIGVAETKSNSRICVSDDDWFVISDDVLHGQQINISAVFSNSLGNLDLELYFDDGTADLTLVAESKSDTDNESILFTAGSVGLAPDFAQTTKGVYYIKVIGRTGSEENDYNLTSLVTGSCGDKLEGTGNNTSGTATSYLDATGGASLTTYGLYICPSDEDWFTINNVPAGANVAVNIYFTDSTGDSDVDDLDLYVMSNPLDYGTYHNSFTNTDNESVSFTAGSEGLFYIQVVGDKWTSGADYPNIENIYDLEVIVTP